MATKKKNQPFKPRSKWWRLVLAVVPVLVILGAGEGALRLAGFGYRTSFFIPGGDGFVQSNERYAWRFMSPELARDPLPIHLATRKPAGTVRIFILGESAAQGFPDAAFGFSRILEVMLRARHPGTNFEVVNTAMTAINSHAVREIALECLRYEPDLLLLYCGNNEVVGPFGPGTVFQSHMPGLRFIRFQLWLSRTRIWQGMTRVAAPLLAKRSTPKQWTGMDMFVGRKVGSDDPRLKKVYEHFRANIADILKAARQHGIPLVVCTVPVNLEACSPFASEHRRGLSDADERKWSESFAPGTNAEARGDWAVAEKHYAEAGTLDSRFAEADFRRARCLAALGRTNESEQAFSAARDHDALRFRTDSRLNALLRDLARDGGPLVRLYAAEADFAKRQDDFFCDHVHMTFAGNHQLAQGFLEHVEAALPMEAQNSNSRKAVPSEAECARSLACTLWSRWKSDQTVMHVMRRPPFAMQFDHEQIFPEKLRRFAEESKAAATPEELQHSIEACTLALKERPGDLLLRENLQDLLDQRGDLEGAVREARTLATQQAGCTRPMLRLGLALLNNSQTDEAILKFQEAIRLKPSYAAHSKLGVALGRQGRTAEAIIQFQEALRLNPDSAEAHNNLGFALLNQGQIEEAISQFQEALRLNPDNDFARNNLARALEMRNAPAGR